MPYLPGSDVADASGTSLTDSVSALLGEAGLDFSSIVNSLTTLVASVGNLPTVLDYNWLADRLAAALGLTRLQLAQMVEGWLSLIPGVGDMIQSINAAGTLQLVTAVDTRTQLMQTELLALMTGGGGSPDAILSAIAAVRGSGQPDIAAVLTAIGAIPGAPSAGTVASAVWWWQHLSGEDYMWTYMQAAGSLPMLASGKIALPVGGAPMFAVRADWRYNFSGPQNFAAPQPDWSAILADDTRLSWLQRTDTLYTWYANISTGEPEAQGYSQPGHPGPWFFNPVFGEPAFQSWKGVSLAVIGPPLWPGLAGVTLGTPQVLTDSAIIDGPMDGLLVTVDSLGPSGTAWSVDGFRSAYRAGYVIFVSGEGHADETQYIGPADGVFCPKALQTAGSCVVKVNKVAQITVTPWTLAA